MKKIWLPIISFIISIQICSAVPVHLLWDKAEQAFFNYDLSGSAAAIREIIHSPQTTQEDRAKAFRTLAGRDWQFYNDYTLAKKHIDSALSAFATPDNYTLLSDIEAGAAHYSASLTAADKALSSARSPAEWQSAALCYARTAFLQNHTHGTLNTPVLHKAASLLQTVLEQMPGHPQAARQLIGIGILDKNGPLILAGWKAYFHFSTPQSVWNYQKTNAETLAAILPQWTGRNTTENEKIARALASSRFYEYAALLATPAQQDILHYAAFLRQTDKLITYYYQQLALKKANDSLFETHLLQSCAQLLQQLHLSAGTQPLTYDTFLEIMTPRFGTSGFLGVSSGFSSKEICLGHIVNITHKEVLQYGYKGSLTFIEVDLMTSNGFTGWFTDGKSRNGGWSVNDTIYQVREAYIEEPMNVWTMVTDSSVRKERLAPFENVMGSHDTATILNGIGVRMRMDALDTLYAVLKRQGLQGRDLQVAFMTAFETKQQDASIFAHEGRHSIDQIYFKKEFEDAPSKEREYRAKLSEIACAEFPVFLLGKIISRTGPGGHGQANQMILNEVLQWMYKHPSAINGYDPEIPAIKQIYLLSAAQIRNCFRDIDPLYKG
ncbi:hypothetical protein [Chitinophaga pinensis]|uniref:Uncharacterized protein n=1 Tax=Chitinophaga pinensis (strain ATCC 43595 / DSM 2588 / LMG 13176 / NBRC 15968 / NCIMB 11800 / UQM 2034) TaxID=485918 RepID=A0A979G3M0_CHIPD|nr:hypothetical protein [Chitinophaga pinensis]ACU60224.1 hypothetical protein Cpin_2745 [Chitinophaga pinensis DSM 2588]